MGRIYLGECCECGESIFECDEIMDVSEIMNYFNIKKEKFIIHSKCIGNFVFNNPDEISEWLYLDKIRLSKIIKKDMGIKYAESEDFK